MPRMLIVWCACALGLALSLGSVPAGEKGKTVMPFNGTDLKGWKFQGDAKKSAWVVGRAVLDPEKKNQLKVTVIPPEADGGPGVREMINPKTSVDIYTEEKFGDCLIELELMIPKGSNSGIYLMGEYEIQVLDSFGKEKVNEGDMGGIYQNAAPKVNACKAPGEWQKFIIDFQAPIFEDGKKVKNAKFLKVTLNDQVIHENVEMKKGQTPGGLKGQEAPTGPLMFQGNHGPVTIRNIKITPK